VPVHLEDEAVCYDPQSYFARILSRFALTDPTSGGALV